MVLVGKGMVANLSGLIRSDQAQAMTRLMERTSAAGSVIQKRHKIHAMLERRIVESRALAKSGFEECIRLCMAVDVLLHEHETSGAHFAGLIPHSIWEMSADENRSRTMPMLHRGHELKRCLKRRIDRIHKEEEFDQSMGAGDTEFLLAEFPQTWLRAAELLLAVFKIENDLQLPPPWSSLTDKEKEDAAYALDICHNAFEEYHKSCRYNRLYPAYFEALLLESISKDNHSNIHAIVRETRKYGQDREYGEQPWVHARVSERIESRYQIWDKSC